MSHLRTHREARLRIRVIRAAYDAGLPVKAIAADHDVAPAYVSRVCNAAGLRRHGPRSDR